MAAFSLKLKISHLVTLVATYLSGVHRKVIDFTVLPTCNWSIIGINLLSACKQTSLFGPKFHLVTVKPVAGLQKTDCPFDAPGPTPPAGAPGADGPPTGAPPGAPPGLAVLPLKVTF